MTSIIEAINSMSTEQLFELNNIFCMTEGYNDDEFFVNDEEFFNTFFNGKPHEVARATFYGDYNFSHDYVKFNGYGNLETFSYIGVGDLADTVENIAKSVEENPDEYSHLFV
jgi:hypothetical protein